MFTADGKSLRLLRVEAGITVTDLATAMGVTGGAISHLEARDNVHTSYTLSRYLGALRQLKRQRKMRRG